ncbi:MAG: flagellar hook assembly protein FlgD [Rhodospirillales bacterium]
MIIGSSTSSVPENSQSAGAKAKLNEDLNRFLTLLVTQLQNQDPLDPLDATEFTSQLVQFASVEQQIFQNSNLEKLLNLQETNQISQMVDFIGKRVEYIGQELSLEKGNAEFSYVMPLSVVDANVNISNSAGQNVFFAKGDTTAGKHTVIWDGVDKNGNQQSDGKYSVLVSGTDPQGNLVTIEHMMVGSVSGAGVEESQVKLFIGEDIIIDQETIISVRKGTEEEAQ